MASGGVVVGMRGVRIYQDLSRRVMREHFTPYALPWRRLTTLAAVAAGKGNAMTGSSDELVFPDLTPLQAKELRTAVTSAHPEKLSEDEGPPLDGGSHGEPTFITLVVSLTPTVIGAVALWVGKQRKRRIEKLRITKRASDGSETVIEFDRSE